MSSAAVDHPSRRLLVALPDSYEAARQRYETLVPAVDPAAFATASNWDDVLAITKQQAPHGFLRYAQIDVAPIMSLSGTSWKSTEYLMGNHTIAQKMYRHDPAAMLHAPLRTLLYDGPHGTVLAVDQPSLLFASYDHPEIAAVGIELDALLLALIELLDGDAPPSLQT